MNLVFANSDGIEVVNDEYYRVDDIATPMGRGVTTKDEHAILRLYCVEKNVEKLCARAQFFLEVDGVSVPRGPEITIHISDRFAVTQAIHEYRASQKEKWIEVRRKSKDHAASPDAPRFFQGIHSMYHDGGYYDYDADNLTLIAIWVPIFGAGSVGGLATYAAKKNMWGKSWTQDALLGIGLGYILALPAILPLPLDLVRAPFKFGNHWVKKIKYKNRRREIQESTPENELIRNFSRARNKKIKKMVGAFLDRRGDNWMHHPVKISADDFEAFSNVLHADEN